MFKKIRGYIVDVIDAARSGEIERIDSIDLGDAYKWKIAFHFQDMTSPSIINVFKHDALAGYLDDPRTDDMEFSELYREIIRRNTDGASVFDIGNSVWEKNVGVYKCSIVGFEFNFSRVDVVKAFSETAEDDWKGKKGYEPYWHIVLDGAGKPAKAVFRRMPGVPDGFEFNTTDAMDVLEKLGYEVVNTRAGADGLALIGTWDGAEGDVEYVTTEKQHPCHKHS
ncbi:MAG: hypothetical protein HZC51_06085 [Nitrospirae bacterium]|nr:hypothetical protein [Nitrospirota bacterium]